MIFIITLCSILLVAKAYHKDNPVVEKSIEQRVQELDSQFRSYTLFIIAIVVVSVVNILFNL